MADTAALVTGPSMGRAEATLADARFLDLVTYRRSGDSVATPVLFAIDGDRILVRTAHDAGKLKRLRHTPAIEVAAADSRGRRLGPLFTAVRHLRGKGDVVIEISLEAAVSGGLCDLLPADQASEILGVPVLPGVAKTSVVFGGSSCRYVAADSTDSVGIQYTAGTVRDEWETQLAKIGITAEMAVVGLGDAAYRYDGSTSRPGVRLAVFEGDHDIWVVIDSPADHAAIVAAAERVAHRLLDALN
ncbi:MAG TPA: pyridoxamine 5'-phosphate oxidase family protein [Candidatus Limnocylindrales bacterium]|nr:pyridoxamine 5'-phosphate oxidase family protein [Candidatus Limnocylindrales bacterium]